jgi:putative hydrolase of the HAD superfamily
MMLIRCTESTETIDWAHSGKEAMAIQAVVFDVGGVLEITPDLGVTARWEQRLHLAAGELDKRLDDVWRGGSIGTISEQDVHRSIGEIMGMDTAQVDAFMQDIWREYRI